MTKQQTPLGALNDAIVGKGKDKLFHNQVFMYRLLIPFLFDQKQELLNKHYPAGVDDMFFDIRNFLDFTREYPLKKADKTEEERFSVLHRCIFANISNSYEYDEIKMPPYYLEKDSLTKLLNNSEIMSMASNINNTIYNRRPMPKECKVLLSDNKDSYSVILYRCFWLLQYYFAYYHKDICIRNALESFDSTNKFRELFCLKESVAKDICSELRNKCSEYSQLLNQNNIWKMDTLSLSKVIVDIIVEQVNLQKIIKMSRIQDTFTISNRCKKVRDNRVQYDEYIKYVDGYGSDSYDRLNLLNKYAKTNCYAANELATVYYWGKSYWIRDNNYYELEQNYKKAIEWFVRSVELSDPPLQSSCWSISYTLDNMRYESDKEKRIAEEKSKNYLKMAGDYPAAYNAIAKYYFRDAEIIYKGKEQETEDSNTAVDMFTEAVRLADRAGSMDWFYGNNQIAVFLETHKNDAKLIDCIRSRLKLNVPLDIEAQLKYSASYNSPWALKHLALFYIRKGDKKEGLKFLKKAMAINYSAAYYETAQNYYKPKTNEWKELMKKASELSFPRATFELAINENDPTEKRFFLNLCKEQILSEKKIDSLLLEQLLNVLK